MNLGNAVPKQEFVLNNGLVVKIFQVCYGSEPMVWAQPMSPHPTIRMLVFDHHGKMLLMHSVPDDDTMDIVRENM